MKASKQEHAKQLRKFLVDAQRVADVLRTAVRDHFGPTDEKLTEFGVKPFRGRKAKPPAMKQGINQITHYMALGGAKSGLLFFYSAEIDPAYEVTEHSLPGLGGRILIVAARKKESA